MKKTFEYQNKVFTINVELCVRQENLSKGKAWHKIIVMLQNEVVEQVNEVETGCLQGMIEGIEGMIEKGRLDTKRSKAILKLSQIGFVSQSEVDAASYESRRNN